MLNLDFKNKGIWIIVIISVLTLFLSLTYYFYFIDDFLKYNLLDERSLGDNTQNSLYRIEEGESLYYLATNKILGKEYLNKSLTYVGSDIFWNPERCAQMKSFYTNDKIYFFDVEVSNPEENNGEYYRNLLHIYDVPKNVLRTYQLDRYINIAEIDVVKFNQNSSKELEVYLMNKDFEVYKGVLNLQNLSIETNCNFLTCEHLENVDYDSMRPEKSVNVTDLRPYIFSYKKSNQPGYVVNIDEREKIYHYLIGF